MSCLLDFPQFSAIDMNMFQEVTEFCRNLDAGVSEFSQSAPQESAPPPDGKCFHRASHGKR